jgi:hypothetical protein
MIAHNNAATLFHERRFREALDAYIRCYETFPSTAPLRWFSLKALCSMLSHRQVACTTADEAFLATIDGDRTRDKVHRAEAAFTLVCCFACPFTSCSLTA